MTAAATPRTARMETSKAPRFYSHAQTVVRQRYISSGHVLVNSEREKRGIPALKRSRTLDGSAQKHASQLASKKLLYPSVETIEELKQKVGGFSKAGENFFSGTSVKEIHCTSVSKGRRTNEERDQSKEVITRPQDPICRQNVLSPSFAEFGIGTARGEDGKLYMVQLFRGGCQQEQQQQEETNPEPVPPENNKSEEESNDCCLF